MPRFNDLTDQPFERLIAKERVGKDKRGNILWRCECVCGNETIVPAYALRQGHTRSCGCLKIEVLNSKGSNHFNYKNGKSIDSQGYVWVLASEYDGYVPEDWKHKYIKEHRVVMAMDVGRPLTTIENVHHKNGDRADNRIENLELWTTAQPTGSTVEDAIEYALDILREFKPEALMEDYK